MKHTGGCWSLGDFYQHIFNHLWDFFSGNTHEQFNPGHWSYLFKMWTQEQLRDLTTQKVIEECLALFQIKQHYDRQNLDPPAELLANLELFNEEIKT